jgi:hypothetical protein
MPPLSKINKEKRTALLLLETMKNSFNKRTYTAFQNKINKFKKIDAVKRFTSDLKDSKESGDTNITRSTFKNSVNVGFKKKNVVESGRLSMMDMYDTIMSMSGTIKVVLVENGRYIKELVLDLGLSKGQSYDKLLRWYFQGSTDGPSILDEYPDAELIITPSETIPGVRFAQAFKQGITNCVFVPMIEFFKDHSENAKTKNTRYHYNVLVKKAEQLEKDYRDTGVKNEDLQIIADTLQVNIEIELPFQETLISVKSNKKGLTTFHLKNTRLDHVELNKALNKKCIYISTEELQEMYYKNLKEKTYMEYTRGNDYISSISTLSNTYRCKKDYNEFINNFENTSGLCDCKLDDFKQTDLSKFLRQGNHWPGCVDFQCPDENRDYNLSDMKNAYLQYKMSKYYTGFVGKITDFRKTDKIQENTCGFYQITDINIPESCKYYMYEKKLNIFNNFNVYPDSILRWATDQGITYKIIEGCWGPRMDISMNEPEWHECKENDVKYFCKYIGSMYHLSNESSFYIRGKTNYIQNIIHHLDSKSTGVRYDYFPQTDSNELRVRYQRTYNTHLSHISGQILGYNLLNMLEMAMSINIEDILRINVDGIFHYNEYPMCNAFRDKTFEDDGTRHLISENYPNDTFISNYTLENYWKVPSDIEKDFAITECHTGPGGGGKTHNIVIDKGNIKLLYIAPSWKLSKCKATEYSLCNDVWYNAISNDPDKWKPICKYNVLVFDEISMMDNRLKEKLLERYSMCKIIMCGDPGYQLDGFSTAPGEAFQKFEKSGFEKCVEHTKIYRIKCDKLLYLLTHVRTLLSEGKAHHVRKFVIENFQHISPEKLKTLYRQKDMILTRTNQLKNTYKETFKHIPKYMIKNNTRDYSNGEIVYTDILCKGVLYELQHAYTTHSIQGETAYTKLFIHLDEMRDGKMIYTALSRAQYWNSIFILV